MRKLCILLVILLLGSLLTGCGKASGSTGTAASAGAAPAPSVPAETAASSGSVEDRIEGPGFASGEEALLAALDAIRRCDAEALLSCYALETWVGHFRFDSYYLAHDWTPNLLTMCYLPEDTEFGAKVNFRQRRYIACADAARPFVLAANGCFAAGLQAENPDDHVFFYEIAKTDRNRHHTHEEYLQALERGEIQRTLSSLQITGEPFDVTAAYLEKAGSARRENFLAQNQRLQEAYQADRLRDYGVAVSVDGCDCFFSIQAVCYENRWYVLQLGSEFGRMTSEQWGGFSLGIPGGEAAPGAESTPAVRVTAADSGRFRVQGAGFQTDEAAALAYVEALRNLDIGAAEEASLIDRAAEENLTLKAYGFDWSLQDWPILGGSACGEPLSRVTEAEQFLTRLLDNYLTVAARLHGIDGNGRKALPGYQPATGRVGTYHQEEACAALHAYLSDPEISRVLAELEIIGVERVLDETTNNAAAKFLEGFGAEHYTASVVTAAAEGRTWYIWVESVCIDGRWYHVRPVLDSLADRDKYPFDELLT